MMTRTRRFTVSIIGDAFTEEDDPRFQLAEELGRMVIDEGHLLVSGGMAGVMRAASRGARSSESYREGMVLGILPGFDDEGANEFLDVVISTGLGHKRNSLVAQADAVIAVGGGAGTLSEICFAWLYKRLVIGMEVEGWSGKVAGRPLDQRVRFTNLPDDRIWCAKDVQQAREVLSRLPEYVKARKDRGPKLGGF